MHLVEFEISASQSVPAAVEIWNAACGPALEVSQRLVAHNVLPCPGLARAGRWAMIDDKPVGFVLASALHGYPLVAPTGAGWVEALVVQPEAQGHGVGRALLQWAELWLQQQGFTRVRLGGSLRPFAPGVPTALGGVAFFERHGYAIDHIVYDLSSDLAAYQPPRSVREVDAAVRPAQRGQEQLMLDFWRREFPGRWLYEAEFNLADGTRISDFMLLWTERGVDGCCLMTFEDSVRPIERFYPYSLQRPWGQAGTIGISADQRGRGYGALLLDGALRRLHNNGVNGCVIDWTTLLDFYGKFGFAPVREYVCMGKDSSSSISSAPRV